MQAGTNLEQLPLADSSARAGIDKTLAALSGIILGKEQELQLALACVLAKGHLLIEDLPGLGKTTMAQALAQTLGLSFQRIQFTSDLLPADIVGVSIYKRNRDEFEFQRGPIFAQLLLADEVNRATPKAQSALLEAMQEQQVTADGVTHKLPEPFFVVATQNPADQIGTFPLPESQLDRFLMRVELGYPDEHHERALLTGVDRRALLGDTEQCLNEESLQALQQSVEGMRMTEPLLDYIQALVRFSRESSEIHTGLSPRGALALARAAKAYAYIRRHQGVYPDDVQAVFIAVAGHRLRPASDSAFRSPVEIGRHVLDSVAIP